MPMMTFGNQHDGNDDYDDDDDVGWKSMNRRRQVENAGKCKKHQRMRRDLLDWVAMEFGWMGDVAWDTIGWHERTSMRYLYAVPSAYSTINPLPTLLHLYLRKI